MSDNSKRRGFLSKIFGDGTSAEISAALESLQTSLDSAGVERKSLNAETTKGILENLQMSFRKPLEKLTDDSELVDRLANECLALAMGAVADINAVVEPEAIEEEEEDEEIPLIEEMDEDVEEEDEEEELPEAMRELSSEVVNLAKEASDMYAEMKDFFPVFIGMAETVKALAPITANSKELGTLETRIAKLEAALKGRPRQASKDAATVVDSNEAKAELTKGTDSYKTVAGIRVTGDYNGS